jgi:hypothetical protein
MTKHKIDITKPENYQFRSGIHRPLYTRGAAADERLEISEIPQD